jgi:TRAP-type C4-dicarboxylate transport system permease small subunit
MDDNTSKDTDGKLILFLYRVEVFFLIGLFTFMLGIAVSQIFLRQFFSSGITWGDPLVRMLVLWICLIGAMMTTRQDKHIRIDILTRYMPEWARNAIGGVVRIFTAGVCVIMAWQAVKLVVLDFGYRTVAFYGIPAWVCEAIIPFGFAVIALRSLILFFTCHLRTFMRPGQ